MSKLWEKAKKGVIIGYGNLKQSATGEKRTDEDIINASDRLATLEGAAIDFKSSVTGFFDNFQIVTGRPNIVSAAYQGQFKDDSEFLNVSNKLHDSTTLISQKGQSITTNANTYVIEPISKFIEECRRLKDMQDKLNSRGILLDNAESNYEKAQKTTQAEAAEAKQELDRRQEKYEQTRRQFLEGVENLDKLRLTVFSKCLEGYRYVINDFLQSAKESLQSSSILLTQLPSPSMEITDLQSVSV